MDRAMGERIGKYLGIDPSLFDYSLLERRWRECHDKEEKDWLETHTIRKERQT
jgi:hypothetical protein